MNLNIIEKYMYKSMLKWNCCSIKLWSIVTVSIFGVNRHKCYGIWGKWEGLNAYAKSSTLLAIFG